MNVVALIPARYNSSRFPGKLIADLLGKTVIRRTYESAINMNLFSAVYVVTDSKHIFDEIKSFGANVIMSKDNYETGTDRIAEAASSIDADLFINIQGDEPFVSIEPLSRLIDEFNCPEVKVASLIQVLQDESDIQNPNFVKVVLDNNNDALYFSRAPIPYRRDNYFYQKFYEHIGVYAFRKDELVKFSNWEQSELEKTEKIEALRFLENGVKIRMLLTEYMGIEIDTPEDLLNAGEYLKKLNLDK